MTSKPLDDLEAVRGLADLLQPFSNDDRERIIRWAREKLGMLGTGNTVSPSQPKAIVSGVTTGVGTPTNTAGAPDIKSFVDLKSPKSDRQFAAVVAYYYRFESPANDRKDSIGKKDLEDACRLAGRTRIRYPIQTLINALNDGYLDKAESGKYRINTVGENLVAMVLPSSDSAASTSRKAKPKKSKRNKKSIGK